MGALDRQQLQTWPYEYVSVLFCIYLVGEQIY